MRCYQCRALVATRYQHLVDEVWICKDPTIDVLLGHDSKFPPKSSNMDQLTRTAIRNDVSSVGRGFGHLINGRIERIPPDQIIVFTEDGADIIGDADKAVPAIKDAIRNYLQK